MVLPLLVVVLLTSASAKAGETFISQWPPVLLATGLNLWKINQGETVPGIIKYGTGCSKSVRQSNTEGQSQSAPSPWMGSAPWQSSAGKLDTAFRPPRPPGGPAPPRATEYLRLIREMKETLLELLAVLKEKKVPKLILVKDLDETLFQMSYQLTGISLPEPMLKSLQQQWFKDMDEFYQSNQDRILLIFHTTRSLLPPGTSQDVVTGISGTSHLAINMHTTIQIGSTGNERQMLRFPVMDGHAVQFLGIPRPNVLITGSGSHIQLDDRLLGLVGQGRLEAVNASLLSWRQADFQQVQTMAKELARQFWMNRKQNNEGTVFILNHACTPIIRETFEGRCSRTGSQIAMATIAPCGYLDKAYLLNVTVNKGTTLRLVNYLLDRQEITNPSNSDPSENAPPIEVIMGDSTPDLSMLRKDLEITAIDASVSPDSIALREQRVGSVFGYVTDLGDLAQWWFLSIVPDKQRFERLGNETMKAAINHPKIIEAGGQGILSMMKALVGRLRDMPALEAVR